MDSTAEHKVFQTSRQKRAKIARKEQNKQPKTNTHLSNVEFEFRDVFALITLRVDFGRKKVCNKMSSNFKWKTFCIKNGHLIARNARVTHNSVKITSEPETNILGNRLVFDYFVLIFESKRFGFSI